MIRQSRGKYLALAAAVAVGSFVLLWDSPAQAQRYGRAYRGHYGGHGNHGYSFRTWHGPSLHYDRVYHPTVRHYTPYRGWHTHGHYDYVPHYVPGHYDRYHNGHIDLNRRYH